MMNLILSILTIKVVFGAQLMNCPREQVKFEKIIGLRPSSHFSRYLLYKQQHYEPVTTQCLSKCLANEKCVSFVLHYNISQCYWYDTQPQGLEEYENVIDSEVAWFGKTCLNVTNCNKLWAVERIPGSTLIGSTIRTFPNPISREECQQRCADEEESCKSANFRICDEPNSIETLGTCSLSSNDRHLIPSAYRLSSFNDEYFENQCSNETTNEFCAYEEYEDVILTHVDLKYERKSKEECQELCESTTIFNCRGYSIVPENKDVKNNHTCLIHSEDSKIHGPGALDYFKGGRFYEKARCLNITVTCSETYITVKYTPEIQFKGRIYMNGYSENLECSVVGNGNDTLTLKMPLMGNQCGITEAKSTNHKNRTLLSGTMILQYNPIIQTQGDRLVKVGCIFSNETKIILGTGVNFTNSVYPNRGTAIINSTTTAIQPTVEMKIVDFYTQTEISDTQIGQELQLIIDIKPTESQYDIWAGHLIAMTDTGEDSILLLDDRGCPTNPNIFPSLIKVVNNTTKKLTGNFQAFKFTASPIVRFSVIVQFCAITCVPVDCGSKNVSSGKRKRETITHISNTSVTEINKQQYDNQGKNVQEMPLEFVLIVRNTKLAPDRLVYGENNKILVAGYDLATNEVCFDYSLLIGIIVVWIITQIILVTCCVIMIRRYKKFYQQNNMQSLEELHKNFGLGFSNLEPRRVHWADTASFN